LWMCPKWTKFTALTTEPDMPTKQAQWLEDLDDLINRLPDIYLPEPVVNSIMEQLETVQDEVTEQIELRSTDWES